MKIGIFIEPPRSKSKFLSNWKQIVKKNFGSQKYLSHPLHTTIAVFDIKKKINKNIFNQLKKKISSNDSFKIKITKPDIFYNDPLTGGDTLFFGIKRNQKLINFQKKILNHFNKINKNIIRNFVFKNKKYQSNYIKFGFPFVGEDWIPHFTIASVKDKTFKKKKIFKKFLSEKNFSKDMEINYFSIWEINKDKHKRIYKYKFK